MNNIKPVIFLIPVIALVLTGILYFYFLKKGRVVERFEGWPKNGRKDQLIAALDQVEKE